MKAILHLKDIRSLVREIYNEECDGEQATQQLSDTHVFHNEQFLSKMIWEVNQYLKEIFEMDRDLREGCVLEMMIGDVMDDLHSTMPAIQQGLLEKEGIMYCPLGTVTGIELMDNVGTICVEFY